VTLRLYDTATREVRYLVPLREGEVGIYHCGLTVQAAPHVGHIRKEVVFDVLRRWLEHSGYAVTVVANLTDIDDKVLIKAGEQGRPWWAIAYANERALHEAYAILGCEPPTYEPRATGHIPEMVELIEVLLEKGHAYVAGDGSGDVYFDVRSWSAYGELSRQRIEDMEPMAEKLGAMVPSLKLRRAHGKMPAAEIDEEMIRFSSGDGDILLATNIIEAGLDIPRANTMIIWRADRFGLAQLHQLRGRVGRGRSRGYLLLVTEEGAEIAPSTMKRLRTMEALDQLGAGFAISARDLDLRGAGDILGEAQAGHLKLIGLGLYQHLLEQALRVARGEDVEEWMPELHLGLAGRFPEAWIPEEEVRINLYARLARASSSGEVDALAEEIEDRFGALPAETATLIEIARIRLLAREAGIARVDAGPAAIALTPRPDFAAEACGLERKGDRLLLKERTETDGERLTKLRAFLERLAPDE
jgi:hypothetical protein